MNINPDCILCYMRRNVDTARKLGTAEQLDAFTKGLLNLYLSIPEDVSAVWTAPGTDELYKMIYGIDYDRFTEEKAPLRGLRQKKFSFRYEKENFHKIYFYTFFWGARGVKRITLFFSRL